MGISNAEGALQAQISHDAHLKQTHLSLGWPLLNMTEQISVNKHTGCTGIAAKFRSVGLKEPRIPNHQFWILFNIFVLQIQ
jgi:hypothetical protein